MMRRWLGLAIATLAVAGALVGVAVPAGATDGTFTGRLVDSVTGEPVAGATVDAGPGMRTSSGADGRFVLPVRGQDEYRVVVVGSGVGYEDGDVGLVPRGRFGWPVVPEPDAVVWIPRDFGDIELDRADVWGFSGVGDAVYGVGILVFTAAAQAEWDVTPPGGPTGPKTTQCMDSLQTGRSAWLLSRGFPAARLLPEEGSLLPRIEIPDIPTARPYAIQFSCLVDGLVRSACVNIMVGPGRRLVPPGNLLVDPGEPLLHDPCPATPWVVVDRSLTGFQSLITGARIPLLRLAFAANVTTTTSTTRPPSPGAPPTTQPPPPAGDTTPPTVVVQASGKCPGNIPILAHVTDNVGVSGSVTFAFTGPMSGDGTMSGSPPNYSGSAILVPGTYQITVTARDAAGNVGTGTTSVKC